MRPRLLLVLLTVSAALAGEKPASPSVYQDFIAACTSAYAKSGAETASFGADLCACTAQESKHQGVTQAQLRAETAEIGKDPKYKIKNPALLASFHYCVILAMDGAEGK